VGPGRSLDARGRLRRFPAVAAAPGPAAAPRPVVAAPDAVQRVLQDLHDGTRDAQLGGAAGALVER
jgi:hypothetical protein